MRAIATFHYRRLPPTLMHYACSQLTQPRCATARWVRLCFSSGGLRFALVLLRFSAYSFCSCNLRWRMRAIATFHYRRLPPTLVRYACSQLRQPRYATARWVRLCFLAAAYALRLCYYGPVLTASAAVIDDGGCGLSPLSTVAIWPPTLLQP